MRNPTGFWHRLCYNGSTEAKNKREENRMKSLTVKSALALMVLAAGCAHEKAADGDKIVLASASGSATVSLTGGRVLSWKDADGRELFFMPER
jgi:D-hexose-6-phosphate mutarotase